MEWDIDGGIAEILESFRKMLYLSTEKRAKEPI